MSRIMAVAGRELKSLFYSPVAYIVLVLYLLFVGLLFSMLVFIPGELANPQPMFAWNHLILIFIVPFITMSLLAEEYRSGRIEVLRTSPLAEMEIILGKFLGAMGFYCVVIASSVVFVLTLMAFGRPDFHPIFTSYMGLLLMGSMMVAIGVFFSALSEHQILAAMSTCVTLVTLGILVGFVRQLVPTSWFAATQIRHVLGYMAIEPHMANFARGVVDTQNIVYFLTGTCLFLFLTYVVLESRRWR